ncbi:MAG: phosphate/phosphite/phosphonate ABC transporter substrate-binding protein [Magnetococcales bacterium]|nr:phosphate/phosphite/phosphonate ABC transporter substrate-binding protein [Magnetococcales bacterium]MBF0439516.1 phosphate/phosphite/phosphonate ABC transporter substrate-binding protein [Magnetococcales bacterium]
MTRINHHDKFTTYLPWLLSWWLVLIGSIQASATPLTIGSISNDPAKEISQFLPLVRHLATQLTPQGITSGEVVIAASMQEMASLINKNRVDLYLDSPLPSAWVNQATNGKMVLRRWKKGQVDYRSILFVKKESNIHELSQLAGKMIGFKDPFSSSGYLLPRIAMEQAGLQLVPLKESSDPIPPGKTGYLFTNDRETNVFWVTIGKISAGAIAKEELEEFAKKDADQLRIIHETFSIPRHVVNIRGNLPETLEKALIQTLQEMEHHAQGKQILEKFQQTTRFDAIPPESYTQLQKITPIMSNSLDTP